MTAHTTTGEIAFLLARCDDAEAEVQHWPSDGPWGLHPSGRMWTDAHGHPIYAPRDRVLAEVKAHRAIVAELQAADAFDIEHDEKNNATAEAGLRVIRHLASIHSAHPDYDESWRP